MISSPRIIYGHLLVMCVLFVSSSGGNKQDSQDVHEQDNHEDTSKTLNGHTQASPKVLLQNTKDSVPMRHPINDHLHLKENLNWEKKQNQKKPQKQPQDVKLQLELDHLEQDVVPQQDLKEQPTAQDESEVDIPTDNSVPKHAPGAFSESPNNSSEKTSSDASQTASHGEDSGTASDQPTPEDASSTSDQKKDSESEEKQEEKKTEHEPVREVEADAGDGTMDEDRKSTTEDVIPAPTEKEEVPEEVERTEGDVNGEGEPGDVEQRSTLTLEDDTTEKLKEENAEVHLDQEIPPPTEPVDIINPVDDDLNILPPLEQSETEETLPSYEEWKSKKMKETEELEASHHETNGNGNGMKTTRSITNNHINYAAHSCGAKVLATNNEAQNPSSILTENKDHYMIQPCKAEKWFVVELCEMVQLQSLEIANLELFSSLPESFVASISDRYPTKDWKRLGTFHARDERTVQSFAVKEAVRDMMFSKYIKIEMIDHFGSEHFCPLTIIRVFGTIEEEDYTELSEPASPPSGESPTDVPTVMLDDNTDMDIDEDLLRVDSGEDDGEESGSKGSGLLSNAKETLKIVKNIVSKVLSGKPDSELNSTYMDDVVKMNTSDFSKENSANKTKNNETSEQENDSKPCYEEEHRSQNDGKTVDKTNSDTHEASPENTVPPTQPPPPPPPTATPSWVTLVQSPIPTLKQHLVSCECSDLVIGVCGFLSSLVTLTPPRCCNNDLEINFVLKHVTASPQSRDTIKNAHSREEGLVDTDADELVLTPSLPITEPSVHHATSALPPTPTRTVPVSPPSDVVQQTDTVESHKSTLPADDSHPGAAAVDDVQITPTPTREIAPTTTDEAGVVHGTATNEGTLSEDTDDDNQNVHIEAEAPTDAPPEASTSEDVMDDHDHDPIGFDAPADDLDIYAQDGVHPELVHVEPPPVEEPIQKLANGRKDNTLVRLKNRIKELELNLSLSSQYLEELSKSYKRKMEDMYNSLNQTIAKLSETSRSAEQRDYIQQKHISVLQEQVQNITSVVTEMKDNIATTDARMIDRHLLLMAAEAIIFVVVISWCIHQNNNRTDHRPSQNITAKQTPQSLGPRIRTISGSVSMTTLTTPPRFVKGHKRHSSTDMTPSRGKASYKQCSQDDSCVTRLSECDDGITIIKPLPPLAFKHSTEQKKNVPDCKKKRKKKNKGAHSRTSSMELLQTTQSISAQNGSRTNTHQGSREGLNNGGHSHNVNAGLMFNGSSQHMNGDEISDDELYIPRCPSSPSIMNGQGHSTKMNVGAQNEGTARKRLSLENSSTNGGNKMSNGHGNVQAAKSRTNQSQNRYEPVYKMSNGIESYNPYRIVDIDGTWKDWDPDKSK